MASNFSTNGGLIRCVLARTNIPVTDSDQGEVFNVWDHLAGRAPTVDWAVENNIHFESQSYLDVTMLTRHYVLVAFISPEQLTDYSLRFS